MSQDQGNQFGSVPHDSEAFRKVPNDSESFGNVPNDAERFGNLPKASESKGYCTLTVREAARMFEAAGVARTERSIINWCQPNKQGIARLDNYFDPNERKYFISPQSVELAIQEEKAKAEKMGNSSEPFRSVPQGSESEEAREQAASESESKHIRDLEREVMDLQITNRVKEGLLEQLQNERKEFSQERQGYIEALVKSERHVGELEAKLLQLEGPKNG